MPPFTFVASQAKCIYLHKNLRAKVQRCCANSYFDRQWQLIWFYVFYWCADTGIPMCTQHLVVHTLGSQCVHSTLWYTHWDPNVYSTLWYTHWDSNVHTAPCGTHIFIRMCTQHVVVHTLGSQCVHSTLWYTHWDPNVYTAPCDLTC